MNLNENNVKTKMKRRKELLCKLDRPDRWRNYLDDQHWNSRDKILAESISKAKTKTFKMKTRERTSAETIEILFPKLLRRDTDECEFRDTIHKSNTDLTKRNNNVFNGKVDEKTRYFIYSISTKFFWMKILKKKIRFIGKNDFSWFLKDFRRFHIFDIDFRFTCSTVWIVGKLQWKFSFLAEVKM